MQVSPEDLAAVVMAQMRQLIAPLVAKTAHLEQRLIVAEQRVPESMTDDEVEELVVAEVSRALHALPVPQNGKDGTSVSLEDVEPLIELHVEQAVKALPSPRDGRSVTVEELVPVVAAEVAKAVAGLPVPKDGQSVTIEDVTPVIAAEVARALESRPVAKDGVGLTGAMIAMNGHLMITLTDGTVKDVGLVVGQSVDWTEVKRTIAEQVAQIPKPKDGEKGEPGRDGTLENMKVEQTGERSWRFVYKDGQPVDGGEFSAPIVIYRGVYVPGKSYEAGDSVTFNGSLWIARTAASAQPGTNAGASAWQLSAKRGGDGKPGKDGKAGEPGKPGQDRAVPVGPHGEKW